jgi:small subunit ribosomal protein S17
MEKDNKQKNRKKFEGTVVSDKMDKTIVVNVNIAKMHAKYKKRYVSSKKYKVHDEKNQYKTGDKVVFAECRPISKDKRWRAEY